MAEDGKVYYNKLVRDGIPAKIARGGGDSETRVIVDPQEFQQELMKKLAEEARAMSLATTREGFLAESADFLVAFSALKELLNISDADVVAAIAQSLGAKGEFKERLFLLWSSTGDGYVSNETPQGIHE